MLKSLSLTLLLCFTVQTGYCFLPVRVGHLASIHSDYSISGQVHLLDRSTVYIKDFDFTWNNAVPGLTLKLKGVTYHNNSVIRLSDVGEGMTNALECLTDSPTCCRGRDNPNGGGQGEWYYPDGTVVPSPANAANSGFYRARGIGEIRFNRRAFAQTPTGKYCCKLTTDGGAVETICADLVSDTAVIQEDAHFCVGYTPNSTTAVVMPMNESSIGFNSLYSRSHIQLRLPSTRGINHLEWIGVCTSSSILTRITLHPSCTLRLPCEAKLLGDLPDTGSEGISGRVYLVNRETFAVLGFHYQDSNSNDAVFLTGVGTPSLTGYQLTSYTEDVSTSLGVIVNQDSLVNIPSEAVGLRLNYLSVWSRSRNQALSTVTFSGDSIPPLPTPVPGVRLGNFYRRLHQVSGTAYAMNDTQLYIQRFNYDGTAPAVTFRAIRGTHYLDVREYADLYDERGNIGNLRAYNFEDIILDLPEGYTVYDTDQLIIWCEEFRTSFGELVFPNNVSLGAANFEMIQPPPPTIEEECPSLNLEETRNCKRLHDDLTMSWVIDEQYDQLTVELCGCNMDDLYVGFGLSGSNAGIRMYNSDPVWAWLDNTGVHAEELTINAYSQCNFRTGNDGIVTQTGACPEATSNVTAVNAYVDGCTTCFKFNRPIRASDGQDKAITPGLKQWVVWAIGPVGSLVTPTGSIIPIPFKHYLRADYTDQLDIDFGRAPRDECGTAQCRCNVQTPLIPWRQETLEHTTTVSVRIGQSGGKRGYAGITGIVGWGISIYLNETLIPQFTVYRGVTYTFVVETGDNPENPARYHPFYITSSERGGYSTLSAEDQEAEQIYAGVDSNGNWLGVGRFCYYGPEGPDLADDKSSFSEYKETLKLQCDQGEPGRFTWTPDEDTPDTVYYQCASHQYLGWKINVVRPPPELRPIEIDVASFSPVVVGNSVQLLFSTSKAPTSLSCQLLNKDSKRLTTVRCKRDFGNSYLYNITSLSSASYEIIITLNKGLDDELVFRRDFEIFLDPLSCGVYLRDEEGVSFDTENRQLTVKFSASGFYDSISCSTNDRATACGRGEYSSSGVTLKPTWNKVCIETNGCMGEEKRSLAVYFNKATGDVATAHTDNCTTHSLNISVSQSATTTTISISPTSLAASIPLTQSIPTTASIPSTTSIPPTESIPSTTSISPTESIPSTTSISPTLSVSLTPSISPSPSVPSTSSVSPSSSSRMPDVSAPARVSSYELTIGTTSGPITQVFLTTTRGTSTGTTSGQMTSHVQMPTTVVSRSKLIASSSLVNEQVSSTTAVKVTHTEKTVTPTPIVITDIGVTVQGTGGENGSPRISSTVMSLLLSVTLTIAMATIASL